MTDEEKREQVAAQCKAVAHMAQSLMEVHLDYERMFQRGNSVNSLIDIVGNRTASFMEQLGDMLNAMDACEEEDKWMTPIFKKAQELWPQEQQP